MSEQGQDAWFYTQQGERIGPVTLSDLRVKAQEATLNPRLDMVWTQGMAEWKPSGEIEGLFEKRGATEQQESLAPPADPYAPPKEESVADKMSREGGWPGSRRRTFLAATFLFPIVWNVAFAFGGPILAQQLGPHISGVINMVAVFVPLVVAVWYSLKRLVNLGMSRWWFLGNFVPFINFWVGYRCFACPAGYAYHKKLDGIGIALAIFYWLLMLVVLLVAAAGVALMFNAIGDPEMQQQFRELMQEAQQRAAKP
jgi:uncharacterized membrane protein YhaH (DUF805 family)